MPVILALGSIMLVCVVVLLAPIVGAIAGWLVGLILGETILSVLNGFGVETTFKMWELGATLGFIGGFFKSPAVTNE